MVNKFKFIKKFNIKLSGHCQSLAPEYEKFARAVEGMVNVGAVDMTTDQVKY